MKLSNQYRGLETEELQFLADKAKERRAAERKQEEQENAEISEYREWVLSIMADVYLSYLENWQQRTLQ